MLAKISQKLKLNADDQEFLRESFYFALFLRVILFLISYYTGRVLLDNHENPLILLFRLFSQWDTLNYYYIAKHGYVTTGSEKVYLVFFPLFPLLMGILYFFIRNELIAGLIISFFASVVAGFYLQRLVFLDRDKEEAKRALTYFSLFPTAYFLIVPYTESLFLALVISAFYYARQKKWFFSGILGMFACLTRMQGLILFPALIAELLWQEKKLAGKKMLKLFLIPTGFAIYLLINWYLFADPLAFLALQKSKWNNYMVFPWYPVIDAIKHLFQDPPSAFRAYIYEALLVSFLFTAGLLVSAVRWLRPSYQVYAWGVFVMVLLSSWLMSLPRYILSIFPLFIILASYSKNARAHHFLYLASGLSMASLAVIFFSGKWGF